MQLITLSNGIKIPQFGLGMYKMSISEMRMVLKAYYATSNEMLHIDGATVYENQVEFAEVVRELQIPREKLFLTDKLWDTEHGQVEAACRGALKRLNTSYLDLYLIHWPFNMLPSDDPLSAKRDSNGRPIKLNVSLCEVWGNMEKLVDLGLVKCIGLSNFCRKDMDEIVKCAKIMPSVLQIESHPWLPQQSLIDYCSKLGIMVEAYSPLGTSLLIDNAVVKEVAKEVDGTPAQVLLAFARQRGLIALCKTGSPRRLLENLTQVHLNDNQMNRLYSLENGKRLFHPVDWYGSDYKEWPNSQ